MPRKPPLNKQPGYKAKQGEQGETGFYFRAQLKTLIRALMNKLKEFV